MNKFNKGKKIGIIACVLASISLVGVGFSTWIIETRTDSKVDNITVTVADTKNASIIISDASATDNTVKFDADHSKTKGGLISCESTDEEDLSFTLTYKVTVGTSVSSFEIKAAIDDTSTAGNGKYNQAVNTYKYISLPNTLGLKTGTDTTDTSVVCFSNSSTTGNNGLTFDTQTEDSIAQTKTYTVTQVFSFSWGEAFNKKNPVEVSSTDPIYSYSSTLSSKANATIETLTANTKGLKNLNLSSFNVILSIGNVSTSTN